MTVMPAVTISIIRTSWPSHKNTLKELREEVFMREQNISALDEWDGKDDGAIHYLAFREQKPVACARMLTKHDLGKIGRVCVLPGYRRQHIATQLLQFIISDARNEQLVMLKLDAQTNVLTLYTGLGFQPCGNIFQDAGIPHQSMFFNL